MTDKFKMNPNFERELEARLTPALEEIINEVQRDHAGGDESKIREALLYAAEQRGVRFEPSDELVAAIAAPKL